MISPTLLDKILSQDALFPVAGGASGGATLLTTQISPLFPTAAAVMNTVILTMIGAAVGAVVGYLIKVLLDKVFKKEKP